MLSHANLTRATDTKDRVDQSLFKMIASSKPVLHSFPSAFLDRAINLDELVISSSPAVFTDHQQNQHVEQLCLQP